MSPARRIARLECLHECQVSLCGEFLRTAISLPRVAHWLPAVCLAGCSPLPVGPSVLVLPGSGRSFETFQSDDAICRQFALGQVQGVTPNRAAMTTGAVSAVTGAAVGAAAGAAIGGGEGALIGAGSGLAGGSLVGAGLGSTSGSAAQDRFDMGYIQCMYAKGHRVPVSGRFEDAPLRDQDVRYSTQLPPPPMTPPPPPPPSGR